MAPCVSGFGANGRRTGRVGRRRGCRLHRTRTELRRGDPAGGRRVRGHAGADWPPLARRHGPGRPAKARQRRRPGPAGGPSGTGPWYPGDPGAGGWAPIPRRDQLPEPLAALADRNALELSHARYPFDVNRLLTAVQSVLSAAAPAAGPTRRTGPSAGPTRLDEDQVLAGVPDDLHREALRALFEAARSAGLVFEWGTVSTSIRLYTRDRAEPLTVAWVFPAQGGWYGLRHLTLGFDRGSAIHTPSVHALLDDYVRGVARIPRRHSSQAEVATGGLHLQPRRRHRPSPCPHRYADHAVTQRAGSHLTPT